MQRRAEFRLDADDLHVAGKVRRHAADQPAAADGDQHGVEVRRLTPPFERRRALPDQRFRLVVGVDEEPAIVANPVLARGVGILVALAADHDLGAIRRIRSILAGVALAGT